MFSYKKGPSSTALESNFYPDCKASVYCASILLLRKVLVRPNARADSRHGGGGPVWLVLPLLLDVVSILYLISLDVTSELLFAARFPCQFLGVAEAKLFYHKVGLHWRQGCMRRWPCVGQHSFPWGDITSPLHFARGGPGQLIVSIKYRRLP